MKKMIAYSCYPVDEKCEGGQQFIKSAWCGEGYDRKSDANDHKKFFEKKFGCEFYIDKYEIM